MTKLTDNQSTTVKKSMTKMEQILRIANDTALPRKKVDEVLQSIANLFAEAFKKGEPFSFIGLLKLYTVEKPFVKGGQRPNPFKAGEMITYPDKPAHKAVRVKPLKKLKEMVN